jgi:hypothetical protein
MVLIITCTGNFMAPSSVFFIGSRYIPILVYRVGNLSPAMGEESIPGTESAIE